MFGDPKNAVIKHVPHEFRHEFDHLFERYRLLMSSVTNESGFDEDLYAKTLVSSIAIWMHDHKFIYLEPRSHKDFSKRLNAFSGSSRKASLMLDRTLVNALSYFVDYCKDCQKIPQEFSLSNTQG